MDVNIVERAVGLGAWDRAVLVDNPRDVNLEVAAFYRALASTCRNKKNTGNCFLQ